MIYLTKKPIYIISILALLFFAVSCNNDNDDKAVEAKLSALDDSIGSRSPEALKMATDVMHNAKDSLGFYEGAARLAKYYMQASAPDSALYWSERVQAFVTNPKTPRERALLANALNTNAGYLHNFHKDTDKSIELYKKAYTLLMESDDYNKGQAPDVCANLGDAYYYKNKLPDAASWYRRAMFLTDSLSLPTKQSLTLYLGLALIYQQLGDNDRALELYKRTDSHFNDMTVSMQAYFLNNYGCYYYYLRDYWNSLKLYLRLKHHLEVNHMENNFDMYLCKINLADVYLNLKDTKNAEKFLNEVEPFWKKTGDATAIYYCTSIRLGIATLKGDKATAAAIANDSDTEGKGMMFSMRQIRNRYLRRYYEQNNNWRAAYYNLREDERENDSLDHNRTNMRTADIMAEYNQDTIQLHNSLRMEHKEAEVSTARLWLVIAIAITIVLLLMMIVLILRSHRRKLRNQMQVMQLRLESARNRISPHFVFNVLNNRIVDADKQEADELFDLSKLIRANLDMAGQMTVTLAEELEFVQKYVRVESKLLVDDDFKYTEEVADDIDAEKTLVPSMFIQILVENAFKHALLGRKGHKALTVSLHHEDKAIHISILDNGPGFNMQQNRGRGRTGLNVIRQTIAIINEQNRQRIIFSLHNKLNDDGTIYGCEALFIIPDGIKYPHN